MLIGKYLKVLLASKLCFHLPDRWQNRISSIFTRECIILYTRPQCKADKLKVTLIKDKIYFGDNLHHPSNTRSNNFLGST